MDNIEQFWHNFWPYIYIYISRDAKVMKHQSLYTKQNLPILYIYKYPKGFWNASTYPKIRGGVKSPINYEWRHAVSPPPYESPCIIFAFDTMKISSTLFWRSWFVPTWGVPWRRLGTACWSSCRWWCWGSCWPRAGSCSRSTSPAKVDSLSQ